MKTSVLARPSVLALVALAASLASADVAFDNFGPGDTYVLGTGYTVSSSTSIVGHQSTAMQFTSATTGTLSAISVVAFRAAGDGLLQIGLYSDAAGSVGAALTTFEATATSGDGSILTGGGGSGVSLVAGQTYWVGLIAKKDTWAAWNDSLTGSGPGEFNFETSPVPYNGKQSVFRVETVPEPASIAALGLGALGFLKRRKKA